MTAPPSFRRDIDKSLLIRKPVWLLLFTLATIAITEMAVMSIIRSIPGLPEWLDSVIDAVLLVFLTFPMIYLVIFRPFISHVHESSRREDKLRDGEEHLRQILDTSVDAIIRMDAKGYVIGWNASAHMIFGWSPEDAIGKKLSELIIPIPLRAIHETALKNFHKSRASFRLQRRIESPAIRRDGRELTIEMAIAATEGKEGLAFSAFIHDISARKAMEHQVLLAAKVFETSGEGIVITNADNNIISVNPSFTAITGYDPADVLDKNPRILASNRHDADFYKNMWDDLNQTGRWQGEIWNRRKEGSEYLEWLSIVRIGELGDPSVNYIGTFSDITLRKASAQRVEHLAYHDQLTGLPNRLNMERQLTAALALAYRHNRQIAVMFMDLDRFKVINDNFGHAVGDALLCSVANRLTNCIRTSDTVCRLGGDEFIILLNEITDSKAAEGIAKKIIANLAEPFEINDIHIEISTSIGIALFPDHDLNGDELIKCADIAMYRAKAKGTGNFCIYSPEHES